MYNYLIHVVSARGLLVSYLQWDWQKLWDDTRCYTILYTLCYVILNNLCYVMLNTLRYARVVLCARCVMRTLCYARCVMHIVLYTTCYAHCVIHVVLHNVVNECGFAEMKSFWRWFLLWIFTHFMSLCKSNLLASVSVLPTNQHMHSIAWRDSAMVRDAARLIETCCRLKGS